jgi:hypothetical protein
LNKPGLVPVVEVNEIVPMIKGAVPLFVIVVSIFFTVWSAGMVVSVVLPLNVTAARTPVPVIAKVADVGVAGTASVNVSLPPFGPIVVGRNARDAVQVPPGGKVAGSEVHPEPRVGVVHCKGFAPVLLTLLTTRDAVLVLVLVIVAVWEVLVVLTSWLPNAPVAGVFHVTE